ncbi:MAG: hypothetical protein HYV07_29595 [Deltaproteobacteria bacterium]|nr:hypothetical protein [Deltaproteobacteria bacterium]
MKAAPTNVGREVETATVVVAIEMSGARDLLDVELGEGHGVRACGEQSEIDDGGAAFVVLGHGGFVSLPVERALGVLV